MAIPDKYECSDCWPRCICPDDVIGYVGGCPTHSPEFDVEDDYFNGRACPYFARYMGLPGHDPEATCTFGCVDEPYCITDQPTGGWPPLAREFGEPA